MHHHRPRPLIAGLLAATLALSAAAAGSAARGAEVTYVGTYVWRMDDAEFGGFSGLEMSADGSRYWALSDRATIRWGSVERDAAGRIRGLTVAGRARLSSSKGVPLKPGYEGDSEGLALAPDGALWVSFEGLNRIARYATPDSPAEPVASPKAFRSFQNNGGLEALAVMADGTMLTLPERSGAVRRPFPFYRWRRGTGWDQPFALPRTEGWLPVGADVGPDGRLYLLERDFHGMFGFANRIRRFTIAEDGLSAGEVLLTTQTGQYDNLEGIAVWEDGDGIRMTMISDDNFLVLQRTELVEYRVRD